MYGVDEVGRGAWAGPLLVAAVYLNEKISGLNDSKKLSVKKRQILCKLIIDNADYGLGWVSPKEIDAYGLTKSMSLGVERALSKIDKSKIKDIIIDGNINFLDQNKWPMSRCQVKADTTEPCVMAASILAKVSRDKYMQKLSAKYPDYGFASNVGYGTKEHKMAIDKIGLCKEHRLSFKIID